MMKTLTLVVAGAALLAGCATAATRTNPDLDPSATQFTGWVRVSNGEFQLFQEQRDLDNAPSPTTCVSGALPRDAQAAAGDLNGVQATFTGRTAPWSERDGVQTLMHEGARITNQCRGDYVIKADSVRVLR